MIHKMAQSVTVNNTTQFPIVVFCAMINNKIDHSTSSFSLADVNLKSRYSLHNIKQTDQFDYYVEPITALNLMKAKDLDQFLFIIGAMKKSKISVVPSPDFYLHVSLFTSSLVHDQVVINPLKPLDSVNVFGTEKYPFNYAYEFKF